MSDNALITSGEFDDEVALRLQGDQRLAAFAGLPLVSDIPGPTMPQYGSNVDLQDSESLVAALARADLSKNSTQGWYVGANLAVSNPRYTRFDQVFKLTALGDQDVLVSIDGEVFWGPAGSQTILPLTEVMSYFPNGQAAIGGRLTYVTITRGSSTFRVVSGVELVGRRGVLLPRGLAVTDLTLKRKLVFNYTGADQNFTVLAGETRMVVKCFGAGGGFETTGVLTCTDNDLAEGTDDSATAGSGSNARTYTFRTSVSAAYDVKIGADIAASLLNLAKAINGSGVAGTDYGVGTLPHPILTADETVIVPPAVASGSVAMRISRKPGIVETVALTVANTSRLSWRANTLKEGRGGAGGFTWGDFEVTASSAYSVMVGRGGIDIAGSIYGFGGAQYDNHRLQGGGLSGLFTGSGTILNTDTGRAVAIAGGGGAGDYLGSSGDVFVGGHGNDNAASQPNFSGITGTTNNAGGGGGYAGGAADVNEFGYGGKGYLATPRVDGSIVQQDGGGDTTVPSPGASDTDYVPGTGGGSQPGCVVVLLYGP